MICGSEMSGIASSAAARRAYALSATSAATRLQTTQRNRMTSLMMPVIMLRSTDASGALQLEVGIDEEAAERHDLFAGLQTLSHLRVQLALDPELDLPRHVAALLLLHVHDVLPVRLDNRLVRHRERFHLLRDDLDDVAGGVT